MISYSATVFCDQSGHFAVRGKAPTGGLRVLPLKAGFTWRRWDGILAGETGLKLILSRTGKVEVPLLMAAGVTPGMLAEVIGLRLQNAGATFNFPQWTQPTACLQFKRTIDSGRYVLQVFWRTQPDQVIKEIGMVRLTGNQSSRLQPLSLVDEVKPRPLTLSAKAGDSMFHTHRGVNLRHPGGWVRKLEGGKVFSAKHGYCCRRWHFAAPPGPLSISAAAGNYQALTFTSAKDHLQVTIDLSKQGVKEMRYREQQRRLIEKGLFGL